MPYCPKCKAEYVEGYTVCSDCNTTLTETLEEDNQETKETNVSLDEPVLLMRVTNEIQADNIIAILAADGIPAYASHKGSGQYLTVYMGMSNMGMDIFVPASALEHAKEIVNCVSEACGENEIEGKASEDEEDMPGEDAAEKEPKDSSKLRRLFTWLLLAPSIVVLVYIIVLFIIGLIRKLF
jgi:hypothetical protein